MITSTAPSHYEVLEVERGATASELKSAYRARLKVAHPDSGGTEQAFEALQRAWSVLADPDTRRAYDSWLDDTRPVMGGARVAAQQRYEERERAAERATWEARRAQAQRAKEVQAAARRAADAGERAKLVEKMGLRRRLTLSVGALAVIISCAEILGVGIDLTTVTPVLGNNLVLPPQSNAVLGLQILVGVLVAAGAVAAGSGSTRDGPGRSHTRTARTGPARTGTARAMRIGLDVAAGILVVTVLVPFLFAII